MEMFYDPERRGKEDLKGFELVGETAIMITVDILTSLIKIHKFQITPKGKFVHDRNIDLPKAFMPMPDGDIQIFPILTQARDIRNMDRGRFHDKLAIRLTLKEIPCILIMQPNLPVLEMFPHIIQPYSKNKQFIYFPHYFTNDGRKTNSFAYIIIPAEKAEGDLVDFKLKMKVYNSMAMELTLRPNFTHENVFRPKRDYKNFWKVSAYSTGMIRPNKPLFQKFARGNIDIKFHLTIKRVTQELIVKKNTVPMRKIY
jgi:hypothetical protein